jgi:hypothetical protein
MATATDGQASMSDSGQTLPSSDEDELVAYVVVVARDALDDSGNVLWSGFEDVATVKVPPRTKRRTVIERGLKEAGIKKTPELEVRVLDPPAAHVWRAKPPEPQSLRLT